ncbi:MAG: hypothetical protein Kow00127_16300 [Bacteroidales bacterium]
MKRVWENTGLVLMMLLLWLPVLQREFRLFPESSLEGDFSRPPRPLFSAEQWFSGEFQQKCEPWLGQESGFYPLLVRLNNQYNFSLFRHTDADGVVTGRNLMMYEYDYIRELTGRDYLGYRLIDRRMRRLRFLQNFLKQQYGIDLILIFEPGKASVYPDYLPPRYRKLLPADSTNYDTYKMVADRYGVRYLDWDAWFRNLRYKSPFPVYPRYGTHWSTWGATLATDSLIRVVNQIRDLDIGRVVIDSVNQSTQPNTPDSDIGNTMNLLFRLPAKDTMGYPHFHFEKGPDAGKPNVLVVGDSYYWNIFNTRMPGEFFENETFWYFNHFVYPETYYDTTLTDDLDLQKEIEKRDVIFLSVTRRFLYKFDWGFINRLWNLYGLSSGLNRYDEYLAGIVSDDNWFRDVLTKAKINGRTIGTQMMLDAGYMFYVKHPVEFLTLMGPEPWLWKYGYSQVSQKAIPDEVFETALTQFKNERPEEFAGYFQYRAAKDSVRLNPDNQDRIRRLAEEYFLSEEEVIAILAEKEIMSDL